MNSAYRDGGVAEEINPSVNKTRKHDGVMVSATHLEIEKRFRILVEFIIFHMRANNIEERINPSLLQPAMDKTVGEIGSHNFGWQPA